MKAESENARQIEGWALDRVVWTKKRANLVWGFFESRRAAEEEAVRLTTKAQTVRVVPATLILPPVRRSQHPQSPPEPKAEARHERRKKLVVREFPT